ncbi:undecaprenyl-phosphate glucose phosphotransferase [Bacteroidia bacterium]|nr:undecaprenyl-phosphate glucose phosphotransferase [Bacteroidia bacterium]
MNATENKLLVIYIIIDLFLLNLSMLIAYFFDLGNIQLGQQYNLKFYMFQANMAWIITYFTFAKNNLYLRDAFRHRIYRICRRTTLFTVVLIVLAFMFMKGDIRRIYMFSYISIFLVLEMIVYWLIYSYLMHRRSQGWYNKRVLLIGCSETSYLFRRMVECTPLLGYKFVGYVKYDTRDINDIDEEERSCILGNVSQLEQIIKEKDIHVVFSVHSFFRDKSNVEEQLTVCNQMGVRMYMVSEDPRWLQESRNIESLGDFYIMNPQHIPLDAITSRILKRTFDIFFSGFVILIFGWTLLPVIVIIIKLTSKGSVFFVQERTGHNNKSFRCYKFRSMCVNGQAHERQATRNDSRITRFGHFMRKWNVDELPQFLNVLFGQMSVVGPRPHMLKHTEQYSKLIKYYKVRHYVKPGVTGWAQVSGWRGETDETWKMEKRVKYDMEYIENWSFLWDMKIIWLTVFGKDTKRNAG